VSGKETPREPQTPASEGESTKEPQVAIRDMTDKDWRGLMAYTGFVGLIVIIGGCLLTGHPDYAEKAAAYLSGPVGVFVTYYFGNKQAERQ